MGKNRYNGFVLAGGRSSRMGSDKGLITLAGKKMIEYSIEALQPICTNIHIITNNSAYHEFAYPISADLVQDKGPLAGICTALSLSDTELTLIASCDSPNIVPSLFEYLLEQMEGHDAVVPYFDGRLYPLTAIYSEKCLKPFLQKLKENQLKVKDAIESVKIKKVEITNQLSFFNESLFANINTTKELENYAN